MPRHNRQQRQACYVVRPSRLRYPIRAGEHDTCPGGVDPDADPDPDADADADPDPDPDAFAHHGSTICGQLFGVV